MGEEMDQLAFVREKGHYSLQIERNRVREARRFLFSSSLPLANSVKSGVSKTLARLSSLGYKDFSDKNLFVTATYLLRKPGKMIRPTLVFLGAKIIGENLDRFVDIAASMEMLHTASLIHDDIIDDDSVRREMPSTHVKYGKGAAILAGDALIAKAVALSAQYGPKVMESVANASINTCAGELLDTLYQQQKRIPSVREYLKIARLKSGTLTGMCCSIAAKLTSNKAEKSLYGFGLNLGVAFQIRDDLMETIDVEERKKNGGDSKSWKFAPNLVRSFEKQFRIGTEEAISKAADLNNYFADNAIGFIEDRKIRKELATYVDFVRVTSK
jgi:geranylgeranyl pyrophosphate synthase